MKVQTRVAPADLFNPLLDLSSLPPSVTSDQEEIEENKVCTKVLPTSPFSFPLFSAEIGHDPQPSAMFENTKIESVVEPQNGNFISDSAWTPIATTTNPGTSRQKQPKPMKYKPWTAEWQKEINKKLYPTKKTKTKKTTKKKSNYITFSSQGLHSS